MLIEDSSEFTWDDRVPRPGLGRMSEHKQGFVLHSSLAVAWETPSAGQSKRNALRVIGLIHQEYYLGLLAQKVKGITESCSPETPSGKSVMATQ